MGTMREGAAPVASRAVQPIVVLLAGSAAAQPSQYVMERAIRHHDLDWRYLTAEVAPDRLGDALAGVRAMGFCGGHFDEVHQRAALALLDAADDAARAVGAADCFTRCEQGLAAVNLLGPAVTALVRRRGFDPAGRRAMIVGAGKMGRAAAFQLAAQRAAGVAVADRNATAAEELAAMVAAQFPDCGVEVVSWQPPLAVPESSDLLVHAIPAAAHAEGLLLAPDTLRPTLHVLDVNMAPPCGELLREAAARGCPTYEGLDLFVERLALAFQAWTGVEPDRRVMRDAAEEFLMEV